MRFKNLPVYRVVANRHSASIGLATLAMAALTVFIATSQVRGQVIIQDMFSGANGTTIVGQAPDTANLPSGTWSASNVDSAKYTSPNQLTITAANGCLQIPTSSASYTPPSVLTISAALCVNNINAGDVYGRGLGLGFYATAQSSGVAEFNWSGGLTLDVAGTNNAGAGSVEPDMGGGPTGEIRPASTIVPFPTAVFGAFSTSKFYTLSYSIDTTTGQISNVSLSDGTITDTADYAAIDNFDTTGVFTAANTAYAAILNTSSAHLTGFVSNFELSGVAVATGSNWTGGASTTNWATAGNWSGPVPGATTGTANTDTATFNQTVTFQPTTIDAGRNLQNIVFDTASVSSMTIGTTTGQSLLLTSGGTIQTTSSVTNPQTVNAPLVLEGGGTYTFQSGANTAGATLTFGGPISAGAGSIADADSDRHNRRRREHD